MRISEGVIVNAKEDATLSCTADANPFDENTITWKRDDFPNFSERTSIMYDKNGTSYLKITKVTREDLGNFQCIADNGIGNSTVKNVMLIIKRKIANFSFEQEFNLQTFIDKPEIDDRPQFLKFASEAGDTGKLICRSQASPLARYTWARNGSPINSNTTGKYYSTYNQVCLSTN